MMPDNKQRVGIFFRRTLVDLGKFQVDYEFG